MYTKNNVKARVFTGPDIVTMFGLRKDILDILEGDDKEIIIKDPVLGHQTSFRAGLLEYCQISVPADYEIHIPEGMRIVVQHPDVYL